MVLEKTIEPLSLWRQLVAGILLFYLLQQWLLPLFQYAEITKMYRAEPFYIAVLLFLLLSFFRLPLTAILGSYALVCFLIVTYYFKGNIFTEWNAWIDTIQTDFLMVKERQWHRLSGELRTFIFLYGWSLVCYAVSTWMIERRRIGWFMVATFLYLLYMEFVWGANTDLGMIRTFVYGMLLVWICRTDVRLRFESLSRRFAMILPVCMFGMCVIVSIGAAGYVSKLLPTVTYAGSLQPAVDHVLRYVDPHRSHLLTKKVSGYGDDDHRLGGAVQLNHSIAFVAETSALTYWKGESKSIYDGSGWHREEFGHYLSPPEHILPILPLHNDERPLWHQRVFLIDDDLGDILFRGGPLLSISVIDQQGRSRSDQQIGYHPAADRYEWLGEHPVSSYEMTLLPIPFYDANEIWQRVQSVRQTAREEHEDRDYGVRDIEQNLELYTQLPDALPEQVVQLGVQIVGNEQRAFEKAKQIEHYLRSNYEYDTNTTYPDGDFVAHFLFDSEKGYCDHFSTAMVVLLRSQGVPARWVKGYAPGDIEHVDTNADGEAVYTVTVRHAHAHSWVEAYIPELGWIPFDPTPAAGDIHSLEVLAEGETNPALHNGDKNLILHSLALFGSWVSTKGALLLSETVHWFRSYRMHIFLIIIAMLIIVSIWISLIEPLRTIRCTLTILMTQWMKSSPSERRLRKLWEQLYRLYGMKKDSETLREYVNRTARPLPKPMRKSWEQFLQWTERHHYGGIRRASRPNISERWQNHWKYLWAHRKP